MIPTSPVRALIAALAFATSVVAQQGAPQAAADPEEAPTIVAIRGGRVLTDPSKPPAPATVVVTDGKITSVGKGAAIPKGATVLDATGRIIAPSWIDAGNAGLIDRSAIRERATANDRVADLIVPFSPRLRSKLLRAGVGCIYVDLGRSGRLYRSPTAAVALVDPDGVDLHVLEREAGLSFRVAPASATAADLGASATSLRNITAAFSAADRHKKAIEKHEKAVKDYEKKLAEWEKKQAEAAKKAKKAGKGKGKEPTAAQEKKAKSDEKKDEKPKPPRPLKEDPGSDMVIRILDGKAPLRVEAHWREDILKVLGIAKDKKVKVSILGGSEAWRCIDELKEAEASVVLGPSIRVGGARVQEYQARDEIAAILAREGIPFAFMTALGSPSVAGATNGYRFDSLPLVASLAIAEGLSSEAALEALTSGAAGLIGMGDRLGKIAVGFDAAIQIVRGDLLDPGSIVETMVLGDRVIRLGGTK